MPNDGRRGTELKHMAQWGPMLWLMKFILFFVPWKLFSSPTAIHVRRRDPLFVLFREQTSTTWTKFSSNDKKRQSSCKPSATAVHALWNPSSWWKFGLEVRSSTFWHFLASSASWFKVVHNYDWTMYWWNSYIYISLSLSSERAPKTTLKQFEITLKPLCAIPSDPRH